MQLGLGKLGWAPPVFWNSTIIEITQAAKGMAAMHGGEEEEKTIPLGRSEFEALKEKLGAT